MPRFSSEYLAQLLMEDAGHYLLFSFIFLGCVLFTSFLSSKSLKDTGTNLPAKSHIAMLYPNAALK